MKIHEFRAKQLFERYAIPVPAGGVASTAAQAVEIAKGLGGDKWVVKAQIHAGGRHAGHFSEQAHNGGGVRFAASVDEVDRRAAEMLGQVLVTEQTGPSGEEVGQVYVEQACEVEHNLYLAVLVDRKLSRVTLMASAQGGEHIESIASRSPESVSKIVVDPLLGWQSEAMQKLVSALGFNGKILDDIVRVGASMYDMFIELDASLIEINPLAITPQGELLALDATVTFDDSALYRHADIRSLRDQGELQWGELDATLHGLNYVKLNGNIGCMANGAGLAMATVDVIKVSGGEPANFLDVPPSVEVERIKYAFELLLSDPHMKAVLVNIFGGGIMRCDTVADAMILAHQQAPITAPVIVRFAGVNAQFATDRVKGAGLPVTFAENLADAAQRVVEAAREVSPAVRRNWWARVTGRVDRDGDEGERKDS